MASITRVLLCPLGGFLQKGPALPPSLNAAKDATVLRIKGFSSLGHNSQTQRLLSLDHPCDKERVVQGTSTWALATQGMCGWNEGK